MKNRYKLTIAYEGTNYVGWQIQKNGISIQAKLASAIGKCTGQPVKPVGAGRTDAGVHALGQVAHVDLNWRHSAEELRKAINSRLPDDIVLKGVEAVDHSFHAQKDAIRKWYRYVIYQDAEAAARSSLLFERHYAWQIGRPVKITAMRKGAKVLTGRHDFASFQASGATVKTTVRRLDRIRITTSRGICWPFLVGASRVTRHASQAAGSGSQKWILLDFFGEGFLKQMVRNVVGTLVEVGQGGLTVSDLAGILRARDRKKAGICAPPQGLYLMKVVYD